DDALRARAQELAGATDPDHDHDRACSPGAFDGDRAFPAAPSDRDDARLGGAEGYVQIVCPDGTVLRPQGVSSGLLTVSPAALSIARSGSGQQLVSTRSAGTHVRVLTRALPAGGGAVQVARPLTEVDRSLRDVLIV